MASSTAPQPTTTTESAGRVKRTFSRLVDDPMLEDYSLRYAPSTFRRWSEYTVATAALGGIAYLADFAIGASIAITFGFSNALWAILLAAVVIFLTSVPIAYYCAKYSIDMDRSPAVRASGTSAPRSPR